MQLIIGQVILVEVNQVIITMSSTTCIVFYVIYISVFRKKVTLHMFYCSTLILVYLLMQWGIKCQVTFVYLFNLFHPVCKEESVVYFSEF